ncbi:MAG: toll/interleukin-1 receptor domain-containing protein, partial [Candidatus Thorarchaeota archaeon]
MKQIFVSHVEEDSRIALELAHKLDKYGYTVWCYENDSLPGNSYLLNTRQAIIECKAFLLLISTHSMASNQIDAEVVRAYEEAKPIFPVRLGISDKDYKRKKTLWAQAIGTSTSIELKKDTTSETAHLIAAGLAAIGIAPSNKPDILYPTTRARHKDQIKRVGTTDKKLFRFKKLAGYIALLLVVITTFIVWKGQDHTSDIAENMDFSTLEESDVKPNRKSNESLTSNSVTQKNPNQKVINRVTDQRQSTTISGNDTGYVYSLDLAIRSNDSALAKELIELGSDVHIVHIGKR